jgi:hypothetical protein
MKPPFPGLRPYLESESDIFFGQDSALQALIERLNSQHIVTLLGLSGCGKSSLLNAGLLANLRPRAVDGGQLHRWLIAEMKPGDNPLDRLEAALEQLFPSIPVREELGADTSGLERLVARAGLDPRQRVLIVVDQFEELFRYRRAESSVEREDRAAYFVKLLLQTRRAEASQIYVLFAMRSEFLGECAMFYGLAEQVNSGTFLLPKMTRDQLEETIVGPLDDLNIGIEQELVQLLLNESEDQDDGLPLLQHALRRTWETWQRRSQPQAPLTVADFKTFRRPASPNDSLLKHHLNDHLDSIYDDLKPAQQLVAERMYRLLSEHDGSGRAVRRPLPYNQLASEIGPEVEAVVEAFRDVRLGRTFLMPPFPQELAGATIDISHECLLRRWNLLKSWLEAEVRDAKTYTSIAEDADAAQRRQIETGGRKPLAGATLDTYQAWRILAQPSSAWARRYQGAFDPQLQRPLREFAAAMEYLDWSIRLRNEDEAREKANRLRIRKLKISVWAAVGGILVLLLVMYVNRLHAQLEANKANERSLHVQIAQAAAKGDAAQAAAQNIGGYAQQELNQLDATKNPAAAREVLEGVIALSQAKPVAAGWLYLGIVDKTGRAWAPSLVFNKLAFEPQLSADSPILQQLPGRRVRMGDFNNLREYAQPHAAGKVSQVLAPNAVVTIGRVDTTGASAQNVWALVEVAR